MDFKTGIKNESNKIDCDYYEGTFPNSMEIYIHIAKFKKFLECQENYVSPKIPFMSITKEIYYLRILLYPSVTKDSFSIQIVFDNNIKQHSDIQIRYTSYSKKTQEFICPYYSAFNTSVGSFKVDNYIKYDSSLVKNQMLYPFLLKVDISQATTGLICEDESGIENIGNTCYLNSLLQILYHIPILKKEIIEFNKEKCEEERQRRKQREEAERRQREEEEAKLNEGESELSHSACGGRFNFTAQFQNLSLVGEDEKQGQNEPQRNISHSQVFPNCGGLKDKFPQMEKKMGNEVKELKFVQETDIYAFIGFLQKFFIKMLKNVKSPFVNKMNFISPYSILPQCNIFALLNHDEIKMKSQQDIHEILTIIIDYLSQLYPDLISNNFAGEFLTEIYRENPHYYNSAKEEFCVLSLDTKDKNSNENNIPEDDKEISLEECIRCLGVEEILRGDNCLEINNQKYEVAKKINIQKLPPVLFVHLKRFIMENGNPQKVFKKVTYSNDLLIQTKDQKNTNEYSKYVLFAVAVHSGNINFGHYFAYIKDLKAMQKIKRNQQNSDNPGVIWKKFDDKRVIEIISEREVFEENFGGKKVDTIIDKYAKITPILRTVERTAYLLCYIREDSIDSIFGCENNITIPPEISSTIPIEEKNTQPLAEQFAQNGGNHPIFGSSENWTNSNQSNGNSFLKNSMQNQGMDPIREENEHNLSGFNLLSNSQGNQNDTENMGVNPQTINDPRNNDLFKIPFTQNIRNEGNETPNINLFYSIPLIINVTQEEKMKFNLDLSGEISQLERTQGLKVKDFYQMIMSQNGPYVFEEEDLNSLFLVILNNEGIFLKIKSIKDESLNVFEYLSKGCFKFCFYLIDQSDYGSSFKENDFELICSLQQQRQDGIKPPYLFFSKNTFSENITYIGFGVKIVRIMDEGEVERNLPFNQMKKEEYKSDFLKLSRHKIYRYVYNTGKN
ncbi:MAG: hypothetical protein MJ252_19535 [archaeon]|nr:hypothetical protein [archaeon]